MVEKKRRRGVRAKTDERKRKRERERTKNKNNNSNIVFGFYDGWSVVVRPESTPALKQRGGKVDVGLPVCPGRQTRCMPVSMGVGCGKDI